MTDITYKLPKSNCQISIRIIYFCIMSRSWFIRSGTDRGVSQYCLSADRIATKESSTSPAQTHPSISRSVEFEIGSADAYSPFVH